MAKRDPVQQQGAKTPPSFGLLSFDFAASKIFFILALLTLAMVLALRAAF